MPRVKGKPYKRQYQVYWIDQGDGLVPDGSVQEMDVWPIYYYCKCGGTHFRTTLEEVPEDYLLSIREKNASKPGSCTPLGWIFLGLLITFSCSLAGLLANSMVTMVVPFPILDPHQFGAIAKFSGMLLVLTSIILIIAGSKKEEKVIPVPPEYAYIGPGKYVCCSCGKIMNKDEERRKPCSNPKRHSLAYLQKNCDIVEEDYDSPHGVPWEFV